MTTKLTTKPFDAAEFLDTDEAVAAYLSDALDSGDDAVFQEALQTAARARGMAEIARDAGLGRESLYKALQPGAQPRFATVRKVMGALGVNITVATAKASIKKRAVTRKKRAVTRVYAKKVVTSTDVTKPAASRRARSKTAR